MFTRSILCLLSLPLPAAFLFASAALANPTLPWATAQTRGLDYQPYFLSAIKGPVFDAGSNPGVNVRYGHAVALDGDWMLVGVPDRLNGSGQPNGAVFLYQRQGAEWVQRQRIQFGVGGAARCGHSVALNANIALIGCPWFSSEGLSGRGRMLIYRLDPVAGQMSLEQTLLGAAANEFCGYAVATDGTGLVNSSYAAMGCPGRDMVGGLSSRGGVSVYRYVLGSGGAGWSGWGSLVPQAEGNPEFVHWLFGAALSMERIAGDAPFVRLLVGMPGGTPDGTIDGGLAFLFERPASGGSWTQQRRFARPGGSQVFAEFGFAVSLAGSRVAIGAPGAGHDASAARAGMVYRFNRIQVGGVASWLSVAAVGADMAALNPSGGSRFGHAVALSGTDLWVGQPFRVDQQTLSSVWRYQGTGASAQRLLTDIHQSSLLRQGVVSEGGVGFALGVDRRSSRVVVGGPQSTLGEVLRGEVFVYQPPDRLFADRFSPDHLRPGAQFRDCPDCPTMVMIPAGSFTQGSPASEPGSSDNERPQRQVSVPAFAMGQTAVTYAQWDACVADGGCTYSPSDDGLGRGNRPVINVSWNDAQEYVTWLSNKTGQDYRLPSESEWEYATRAGTTGRFNTGDCITTDQANFGGTSPAQGCPAGVYRQRSVPVASFAPNAWGLYDTHGNVSEWVQDCWNGNYVDAPINGSAWMTGDCSVAVLRGGSWSVVGSGLRSARRNGVPRGDRAVSLGFRVARSVSL